VIEQLKVVVSFEGNEWCGE